MNSLPGMHGSLVPHRRQAARSADYWDYPLKGSRKLEGSNDA